MAAHQQTHVIGVRAPEARQGQATIIGGEDFSRPYWKPALQSQAQLECGQYDNAGKFVRDRYINGNDILFYDETPIRTDVRAHPWEPMFNRTDDFYHQRHYFQRSGAPPAPNAPLTLSDRFFTGFNGLPVSRLRDDGTGGREVQLKDGTWVGSDKWWNFRFAGMAIDKLSNELNANVGHAEYQKGYISTWNNGQDDLKNGSYVRFDAPMLNKHYFVERGDNNQARMLPYFALREGDQFDRDKTDVRLAFGIFRVNPLNLKKEGYHATVRIGGKKGEPLYISVVNDGEAIRMA